MKRLLTAIFIIMTQFAYPQMETLIDTTLGVAQGVNEPGGAIIYIVTSLSVLIIFFVLVIIYLYKQTQELNKYTREISEKAIATISGMNNLLDNIQATHLANHSKVSADNEKIVDILTEIKYKNGNND